ncbi:MAG: hypothetical protein IT450_23845 [Phycisphaerales bacterium]|nr:hypothetical protein [Phycisphaerales bacterium]
MNRLLRSRRAIAFVTTLALGNQFLFGCVTDAQFRDFVQSTTVRVFWQTVGTALQSALISAFGDSSSNG